MVFGGREPPDRGVAAEADGEIEQFGSRVLQSANIRRH
jgi:hypothetical protein